MKLSQGVEWGLHCAVLLAQTPNGAALSRRALAQHYALPEVYLGKHLQAMTKAGLLQATPGPRGGFRLARPADEITVLHIVEAIEGTAPPFLCQEIRQRGAAAVPPEEYAHPCTISTVMHEAHRAWRASLHSVTVGDITSRLPRGLGAPGDAAALPVHDE